MVERKWRSAQWKAMSGFLLMVSAIAVVWAAMASFTVHQREQDLRKVHSDLLDAREQISRLLAPTDRVLAPAPEITSNLLEGIDDFPIPEEEE